MRKPTHRSPESRKQQRLKTLGTNNPVCGVCGESDWRTMELNHLAGQNNDPRFTHLICANCHRKFTDAQKDHPADISGLSDELGSIAHFILGRATLFALMVEKDRELAASLFNHPSRNEISTEAQS